MKRKLLTLTLTVMLFVLAFAFQSNAANEREYLSEDQNNIKIINHIVYLKETKNGETYYSVRDWFDTDEAVKTTSEIKILEEIDGIPVTKIETDKSYVDIDELYYYQGTDSNKLVKEIKIPSSIKTICRGAFSPFDAVEEITIPSTVEALEDAMTDMKSLKKATINANIKYLDGFRGCHKLEEVIVNSTKLKTIDERAFYQLDNLRKVELNEGVNMVHECAFYGSGIESITLGAGEIEEGAFSHCKNLKSVKFINDDPEAEIEIGGGAFSNDVSLKKIYFEGVTPKKLSLRDGAFYNTAITNVYYCGSEKKLNELFIDEGNYAFSEAEVTYYYKHNHSFTHTERKSTCKKAGSLTFTCTCGDTYTQTLAKADHKFGEWKVTKKATKEKTGTIKRKCSVCKKSETMAYVYGFKPGKVSKVTIKNHSKNSEYFMATG